MGQLVAVDIGFVRIRVRVEVGIEVGGGGKSAVRRGDGMRTVRGERADGRLRGGLHRDLGAGLLAHGPIVPRGRPWGASDGTEIAGIARSLPGIFPLRGSAQLAAS